MPNSRKRLGPVESVALLLAIEDFGGKYALKDGWERLQEERSADLAGVYMPKARRLVQAAATGMLQQALTEEVGDDA